MENNIVGTREEDFLRLLKIGRWVSILHESFGTILPFPMLFSFIGTIPN